MVYWGWDAGGVAAEGRSSPDCAGQPRHGQPSDSHQCEAISPHFLRTLWGHGLNASLRQLLSVFFQKVRRWQEFDRHGDGFPF